MLKKETVRFVNSLFFCENKAGNYSMQRGISDEPRSVTAIRTD